jgi:O-antigen/teichoic acid export membrane protein
MVDDRQAAKRRLVKNALLSPIAWVFPIVLGFVTTPILVKGLGTDQYGIFAVILGFLTYSFTFGIGKVVAKFIPEFRAAGESGKIPGAIAATFWFSLTVGLLGSLILALLAPIIVSDLLLIPAESQYAATIALYLACGIGLVMMLCQVFQYSLQGLHRFDSYILSTSFYGLMLGVGNIVLVVNGFGVEVLFAWNLIVACLATLLAFIQAKRFVPDLSFALPADRSISRSVVRYGGNIILFQVFGNVLLIFERTWVMRKFGPEAVTYYFVPMLLAVNMQALVASTVQAVFPVVNELLNDRPRLTSLYQKSTKIVLAVVVFICTIFISSGSTFLTLWINAELAANSYSLLIIHTLTFGLVALLIIPLQLAEASNFSSLTAIATGTWLLIAAPLMILTADQWQSEGIAMSRLVAVAVTLPLIPFVEKRFLGSAFRTFWLSNGIRVLLAATATAVVVFQILLRLTTSWITLAGAVTVGGLIFVAVLQITGYLSRDEKELIRELLPFRGRRSTGTSDQDNK